MMLLRRRSEVNKNSLVTEKLGIHLSWSDLITEFVSFFWRQLNGSRYSRMDILFDRPYDFNFFKGCLAQILLGPFLNTLTQT